MIEFGILELSYLPNKFAGLTAGEKADHEIISNQIKAAYGFLHANARRKKPAASIAERGAMKTF
jgi:hypothetical protein